MHLSIIDSVNKDILTLWENTFEVNADVFLPVFYSEMGSDRLLFIGLNPSFNEKSENKILKHANIPGVGDPIQFFHWRNWGPFKENLDANIEKAKAMQAAGKKSYKTFFSPLQGISDDVGMDCEHVDLFFFRKTKQKEFTKLVYDNKNEILTDFGRNQLELSKKLVIGMHPRVIVVANAFASRLFAKEYNLDNKWDEQGGYYISEFGGRNIPVFLCSMVSGGHMDTFTRNRLVWHIKRAILNH
jgi:hypothetical protein